MSQNVLLQEAVQEVQFPLLFLDNRQRWNQLWINPNMKAKLCIYLLDVLNKNKLIHSFHVTVFQYAPTNKLLYAKDIPKFKQEVKAYYKQVREQPSITVSEFKGFLQEESKVMSISLQNLKDVALREAAVI